MNHFAQWNKTDLSEFLFPLHTAQLSAAKVNATVLRLDLLHPAISGNKWFKLKYHLQNALLLKCNRVVTFGGVWSNHVSATAAACKQLQLQCKAFIRSDEKLETAMLKDALSNGLQIEYISRTAYRQQKNKQGLYTDEDNEYFIPEGGCTPEGIKGAAEILHIKSLASFTHILCATGTGTTFAGLVNASLPQQKIIGINVLKGNNIQLDSIGSFLQQQNFVLVNDFHFGGFGKINKPLLNFMNDWYAETKIPTDIIYTGKMFFGLQNGLLSLLQPNDNLLIIHSGGLQGNRSLPEATLRF